VLQRPSRRAQCDLDASSRTRAIAGSHVAALAFDTASSATCERSAIARSRPPIAARPCSRRDHAPRVVLDGAMSPPHAEETEVRIIFTSARIMRSVLRALLAPLRRMLPTLLARRTCTERGGSLLRGLLRAELAGAGPFARALAFRSASQLRHVATAVRLRDTSTRRCASWPLGVQAGALSPSPGTSGSRKAPWLE